MTQENIADAGGAGSLFTGVMLYIVDNIHLTDINDVLVTVTTLGGAVWMAYKIIGQRLDNKLKKQKLDDLEENVRDN